MKWRYDLTEAAPTQAPQRGGAPVGQLQELPAIEGAAILYLRAWCKGGPDRELIGQDFAAVLGERDGRKAAEDWDALMNMFLGGARRSIMLHGLGCKCFGGDESAFANMIAAAASQDGEDALLFASTLMSGPAAWSAVQLALQMGQTFLRLGRHATRTEEFARDMPQPPYLH